MFWYLLALLSLLAPRLAEAHPGHPGGDAAHMSPGVGGVIFGLTLGAAIAAWEKWGRQWEAGRKFAAEAAGTGEPEPDAERTSLAATLGRHLMMTAPAPMSAVPQCEWCGMALEACQDRRNGTICPEYHDTDDDGTDGLSSEGK